MIWELIFQMSLNLSNSRDIFLEIQDLLMHVLPCQEVETSLTWSCTMNLSEPFGFTQTKVSGPSSERIMGPKETRQENNQFHLIFHYVQLCGCITTAYHVQFSAYSYLLLCIH